MAESEEEKRGVVVEDSKGVTSTSDSLKNNKTKRKGIISRIWNVFRFQGDDFEKRLQYISKEEASVLSRMKRRTRTKSRVTRHLVIFSVLFEVVAIIYAIVTTRSMDLNWKMRAFRCLPMFLLPALSSLAYSSFLSCTRMFDRRDQKTLERLRDEKQAKIDELKEKTNYYTTQQLIQKYDPDPAAKAAAATVLASKLGADSGLRVYMGDESKLNVFSAKSNDLEVVQSSGLRNRKQGKARSNSTGSSPSHISEEETNRSFGSKVAENNQLVVVDHYNSQGSATQDGGWIARIAALLVGEDPTQSYALICGNCHMHNGLSRKEDFPYITYYCPHCHALNKPKNLEEPVLKSSSPNTIPSLTITEVADIINSATGGPAMESSIIRSGSEHEEIIEKAAPESSIIRSGSEHEEIIEKAAPEEMDIVS